MNTPIERKRAITERCHLIFSYRTFQSVSGQKTTKQERMQHQSNDNNNSNMQCIDDSSTMSIATNSNNKQCMSLHDKIEIWVESNIQQARHVEEDHARCVRDMCDARSMRAVADQNHIFIKSRKCKMLSTLSHCNWLRNENPCQDWQLWETLMWMWTRTLLSKIADEL